jgi:hypothetical protein
MQVAAQVHKVPARTASQSQNQLIRCLARASLLQNTHGSACSQRACWQQLMFLSVVVDMYVSSRIRKVSNSCMGWHAFCHVFVRPVQFRVNKGPATAACMCAHELWWGQHGTRPTKAHRRNGAAAGQHLAKSTLPTHPPRSHAACGAPTTTSRGSRCRSRWVC